MAKVSHGTKLQRETATPGTYEDIAGVLDIDLPAFSRDVIDTTSQSSAGAEEAITSAVLKTGEVSFEINYDPTDSTHSAATGILGNLEDNTKKNWKILFPDATAWTFGAWVTKFQPKAPVNGKLTAAVSMKITGAPTLA